MSIFEHALHNERACKFLYSQKNEDNKFNDWIITTAFYSALHFVQVEIFPVNHYGEDFTCFEHYFSEKVKNRINKHNVQYGLVSKYLPSCGPQYKWLMDTCMTARYSDYKISDDYAKEAVDNLEHIKSRLKKLEDEIDNKETAH